MSLEELVMGYILKLKETHEEVPTDESNNAYILGIVQENSFELEDKVSAILDVLGLDEANSDCPTIVQELISKVFERTAEIQAAEQAQLEEIKFKEDINKTQKKDPLSPEEEARRRANLIQAYAYTEEMTPEELAAQADDKTPTVVFVDPKLTSRKARKKEEKRAEASGMDLLMRPNLNAAMVKGAEIQKKQAHSSAAAAKREKDKADLKKQKDDAAKKLEDKKKKAAKVERRA